MNTIGSYLGATHRDCDDLYSRAAARVSQRHWPAAERDFAAFQHTFQHHLHTEEDILFPVLQKSLGTKRAPMAELRADHAHLRAVMQRIGKALQERDVDEFFENATIMRSLMRQHRQKENGIVHPIVDSYADDKHARVLARMVEAHAELGVESDSHA